MADDLKNLLIDPNALDLALYYALQKVYIRALIERTPADSGLTRAQWDLERAAPYHYIIFNTRGDIIEYLEEGTKPHIIRPKGKKALRFELGRKARLVAQATTGKKGKPNVIFVKEVHHPGFEGRHFIHDVFSDASLIKEFDSAVKDFLAKA